MKTIIERLRSYVVFTTLCATLLATGSAWGVTTTGYEDFGDTAGVILWRGTQNDFHASTVADVAADGTVGDEYTMNTSGHPWQVFARGQSAYTSPGKVLVYDTPGTDQGYKYNADSSFSPLSFGGMWVKTLAINGQPFSILGTNAGRRLTEFGASGKSTLFRFDASYTINRTATTTFYGDATVEIAQDAIFTPQADSNYGVAVDSAATLKLKGAGTLAVTTMNVAGTLDLSAETVPTIDGDVTLSTGSTLVVPENTTAIEVCSGTLTVGEILVKIGDAEPAVAEVTTSGGSITSISVVTDTVKTFTSDYPSEVPYGFIYTYEATEAVTIPAVTVNGTLKTSGPITITDLDIANGADFEVVAGNTTVGCSADCKLKGNITVDAGATLTNTRTDSLSYNHSMTVDIYGTLAMGATRWSVPGGCTFKLRNGAQVTGTGDGWASLDFINGASKGLDVYGSATIEGKMRVRVNETRIWINENSTLTLSSGIADGGGHHAGFKQVGPGTLELHANSTGLSGNASVMTQGTLRLVDTTLAFPVALQGNSSYLEVVATEEATTVPVNVTSIANNNVTFSGAGKVNGSITKTSAPSGDLATALQSAAWTGTFVADWAGASDQRFDINSYGNANSVVEVTQLAGGFVSAANANVTIVPTVKVSGTMKLDNGYSGKTTTFTKLTGSGTFTQGGIYPIDILVLDGFTGTIVGEAAGGTSIGTINLAETPSGGDKLFSISPSSAIFYNLASTKVTVNGIADDTIVLEAKSDGIYVKNVVTVTVPAVDNTTVTVVVGEETIGTAAGNYDVEPGSVVTVTYAAADGYQISGTTEYTIDTASATTFDPSETTQVAQIVAQIRTGATTYEYYTTLAGALASPNVAYGITLRANIDEDEVTVSSPVMITGAYTISSDVKIVEGGQLQLMLVTLAGKLTIEENGIYATNGGTLNELVTKDGAAIQLTTLSETTAPLAVTTLSVEGDLTIISSWGSAVRDTYYKAISYVTANADIAEGATVDSVNEWSAKVEEEGDNTVVYLAITKVATVDGVYYDDAQDAVDAAVASGEPVSFLVAPGSVTLGIGETLVVSGATLPTVELDDGLTAPYEVEHTVDAVNVLNIYKVVRYVAKLKNPNVNSTTYQAEVKYTSLAAALADVVEHTQAVYANYPAIVTLLANDDVSFADVEVVDGVPSNGSIVIDKSVVINGAGFTVYGNTNADILNATGAAVPGYDMEADLVDGSNLMGFFVKSGNVTFTNITLTEFGDTAYVNKFGYTPIQTASAYTGTLTLNSVNFNKFNRTAVCVRGGTLFMTGGTVTANATHKNPEDHCQQPIEVRGGTATISEVSVVSDFDYSNNGYGAIVAFPDATAVTVTNVDIDFTGYAIWSDTTQITVNGADTTIKGTGAALYAEEAGSIIVSAGAFTGALTAENDGSSFSITGGTFDVDPSVYVASGYSAYEDTTDVWTVEKTRVFQKRGSHVFYTSIAEVLENANGALVDLLVSTDEDATIATGQTLFIRNEVSGAKLTGTLTINGGTLTLDSTIQGDTIGNIVVGENGGTMGSNAQYTLNGTLSGTGDLTMVFGAEGKGIRIQSNCENYSGKLTFKAENNYGSWARGFLKNFSNTSGMSLAIDSGEATELVSVAKFESNAEFNSLSTTEKSLTAVAGKTVTLSGAGASTLNGIIDNGTITKSGTGTLTLGSTFATTGNLTLNVGAGTFAVAATSAQLSSNGVVVSNVTVSISSGVTIALPDGAAESLNQNDDVTLFAAKDISVTVADVTVPSGWSLSTTTRTVGGVSCKVLKLHKDASIDPADPTSSQTVTPTAEEINAAGGDAQAAAKALATVTVPAAASDYVDAATYKTYFTFAASAGDAGAYTVTIAGLSGEVVVDPVETSAIAALQSEAVGGQVTVAVKPGLYYGFVAGDSPTLDDPAEYMLATGESMTFAKPSGTDKGFVKVVISPTPQQE